MRKILFVALFFGFSLLSYSQTDSLGFENLSKESRSKNISDARALLLDKFIEKDFGRVKVVKDYLSGLDDENYIALYPAEFWLLSYWTKEYDYIFTTTELLTTKQMVGDQKRIPPKEDYLGIKLLEKSQFDSSSLLNQIDHASVSKEENEFLRLLLHFLLQKGSSYNSTQIEFNNLSDHFLTNYPGSRFAPFIKKYIRNKFEETGNGIGYSFNSGAKVFGGLLGQHYKNPILFGLSLDYMYRNWFFSMNMLVGFTKTKETLTYPFATWNSGSKATEGCIELLTGYNVSKNNKFLFVPFIGAGVWGISPNDDTQKYPELKKAGVKTVFAPTAGVFTDIKLSKNKKTNVYYWAAPTRESVNLRIGYGFTQPIYSQTPIGYNGSIHRLTVGISMFQRRMKKAD